MKLVKRFPKTYAPHWRAPHAAFDLIWKKSFAALPLLAASLFINFTGTARILGISLSFGFLFDYLFSKVYVRRLSILDGSTFAACLFFACLAPFHTPFIWIVLGIFFTVVIGKECFGGIGQTIFQPSLVGLLVVYAHRAHVLNSNFEYEWQWFLNWKASSIADASGIALGLAILFLILQKLIAWQIPLVFISTLVLISGISSEYFLQTFWTGNLIFAAVFILTDYSAAPIGTRGKIWFAFLGSVFVALLIQEGIDLAVIHGILLANISASIIDFSLRPKTQLS